MGRIANINTWLLLPGTVVPRRVEGKVGRRGNRGSDGFPGPGPLRRLPRRGPLWGVRLFLGVSGALLRPLSVRWRWLKGLRSECIQLADLGNVPAFSVIGRAALLLFPLALFLGCSPEHVLPPRNSGTAFTSDPGSQRTLAISFRVARRALKSRGPRVNGICGLSLDGRSSFPRCPRLTPWGGTVDLWKMCLCLRSQCGVISRLLSLL